MSAKTLRKAATKMRHDWAGTTQEDFCNAVADLLESVARTDLGRGMRESHVDCDVDCDVTRAAAVADAYLKSGVAS